jgi:hypothetical protein
MTVMPGQPQMQKGTKVDILQVAVFRRILYPAHPTTVSPDTGKLLLVVYSCLSLQSLLVHVCLASSDQY